MATAGTPPSPFIHQSFITINNHHNARRPVVPQQPSGSQSRPTTPGSISTNTSTITSITSTTTNSMHSSSPSSSSPGSAILEPAPNQPYAEFVRTWSDAHVSRWLTDNRCGHHAQAFRENDIRGDIILELDMETLKEIGIVSVGDRTRIKTAVAQLRKLCAGGSINGMATQGPRLVVNGNSILRTSGLKHRNDSNSSLHELGSISDGSSNVPTRVNSRSRPPPLQIDNVREKDLPQIQRLDSARLSATPTPRAHQTSSNHTRTPPKGAVPPTPHRSTPRLTVPSSNSAVGGRSRTPTSESSQPPPFTNDPLPPAPAPASASPASPWANTSGERGLPRNPAPGNLGGGSFARATSPLPIGQGQTRVRTMQSQSQSHQRQASSTSSGGSSRGHGSSTGSSSTHPYSSSGTTLAPSSITSHILSPVSESFGNTAHGYAVGRGPFKSGQSGQREDDVRRKLVKFHLGSSNSRVLDVRDPPDGVELLERALRKFGVEVQETQYEVDGILSVGGWGIFLGSDPDAPPLSENELIAVLHTPENPARENLHLRQITQTRRNNKLERIFGQTPPSNAPSIVAGPTSPIEESMNALTANRSAYKKMNRASMISVMSGLGALPASPPTSPGGSKPTSSTTGSFGKLRNFFGQRPPSELITNYLPEYFPFADKKVLKKTARNSMMRQSMKPGVPGSAGTVGWGTQAIKNTSRFSTSTMASARSGRNSALNESAALQASPPRASQEERRQGMMTIPRVSVEMDGGESMQLTLVDEEETAHGHSGDGAHESFLEDMSFSPQEVQTKLTVEDAVTPRAAKRASKITELKPAVVISHAAEDLVTVDNVTTGIEQRRNRDSVIPPAIAEAVQKRESLQPKEVPVDEADDDEEEEDEEDEDEDEEEEEEEDEEGDEEEEENEDDTPDKVTSNAGNRTIKWIRGALIGSGSFGNVYLAMDAQRGLLMAVKQVSLKSTSYSQERKRSMLAALEREIELLKTLQHENIVQYLDSAIDENHLNIFLEYVPGGSVASLLRNYGAFEEALTKNWVKQILRGLEYLHGQTIIHRDIKGANILVDNKGGIKISDFGISKKVEEGFPRGNRMSLQGSVFWMAPEVVKQVSYTSKADIWSVGCLIVEMLTSQHPFPEFSQMQAIFKLGSGTAKPAIPTDITPNATDFLQKTFDLDHNARPSAAELINHVWLNDTI